MEIRDIAVIPASEARRESLTPSVPLNLRGMKGGYSGQAGMTMRVESIYRQ